MAISFFFLALRPFGLFCPIGLSSSFIDVMDLSSICSFISLICLDLFVLSGTGSINYWTRRRTIDLNFTIDKTGISLDLHSNLRACGSIVNARNRLFEQSVSVRAKRLNLSKQVTSCRDLALQMCNNLA